MGILCRFWASVNGLETELEPFTKLNQKDGDDGRDDDRETEKPDADAFPVAGTRAASDGEGESCGEEDANERREKKVKSVAVEEEAEKRSADAAGGEAGFVARGHLDRIVDTEVRRAETSCGEPVAGESRSNRGAECAS